MHAIMHWGVIGTLTMVIACTDAGESTATETGDGAPVCALGWTHGLSATARGSTIMAQGDCGMTGFELEFAPLPPSGGSAPLTRFCSNPTGCGSENQFQCGWGFDSFGFGRLDPNSMVSGSVRVSGSTGSYRVDGNADCSQPGNAVKMESVTFSMPLIVQ